MKKRQTIRKATGKLGVLIPGLNGAVSTTFLTGVFAARRGLGEPFGSLTQMGTIRLGKRTEHRSPLIRDFVSLTPLKDLVFGGWDIRNENCFDSATAAGVLQAHHLAPLKKDLAAVRPMTAVFDQYYVKRLEGKHVKKAKDKVRADGDDQKGHPGLQVEKQGGPVRHGLVREHGDLHRPRRRPLDREEIRRGDEEEPQGHLPEHALRVRRGDGGGPVRQRRPEPVGRRPGDRRTREASRASPSRGRTSRPARRW